MTTEIEAREWESLIRDIRSQLAALAERVARLEGADSAVGPAAAAPPAEEPARAPEAVETPAGPAPIGEEELVAISAALAAYFGVRVHVRQIRLITSPAWAQQGRVSIQASHRLY